MYSFWYQSFFEEYKIDDVWFFDSSDIKWGTRYRGRAPLSERQDDTIWFEENSNAMTDKYGNIYAGLNDPNKYGYNPYKKNDEK